MGIDAKLTAVFYGPEDIDIIFTEITEFDAVGSTDSNASPSSSLSVNIDSSTRAPDRLIVEGYAHCAICGKEAKDVSIVSSTLKKAMEEGRYTNENFYGIAVEETLFATQMFLKDFRINKSHRRAQEVNITTTWEARLVSGTAVNLGYVNGGIVA